MRHAGKKRRWLKGIRGRIFETLKYTKKSLLNSVGGVGSVCSWVVWVAWMRGFVGGIVQSLAWMAWVAWVDKILAWVSWVAWVEILAWVTWFHKIFEWEAWVKILAWVAWVTWDKKWHGFCLFKKLWLSLLLSIQNNETNYKGTESKEAKKKNHIQQQRIICQGFIHLWRLQKMQNV